MDLNKTINNLHRLERAVLPVLTKYKDIKGIEQATGLKEVEIVRALQWLQNKDIVSLKEELREVIELDKNGQKYIKEELPEKKLLKALKKGPMTMDQIKEKAGLTKEEQNIALGILRKKAAVFITKEGKNIILKIMEQGKKLVEKGLTEENFLKKEFPIYVDELSQQEKFAFDELKKRKNILKTNIEKTKRAELTELGKEISESDIEISDTFDRLTPEMLKNGSWRQKKFRGYDIKINVPKIHAAKKQPYRRFLDELRNKFLALGFEEMFGPLVETDFWDMDALFMPQFHSARDIHSAFYIKEPRYGKLDEKLVKKVKQAHENGFNTTSKGWNYKFDEKQSHKLLLRTQTTACSARKIASKDLKIPGKYFAIGRCFRPDVIDATHSADFNQVEGIVIEENLNFRHLKGLLKMFAEEFCNTNQIKIVPAYFPFTEPSAELFAKHPQMGWIELGGAGILRPEVVKPLLGKEMPVLAWGIGIDRIAMFNLEINDIRKLFAHDLNFLRNQKVI
ncbi:phenylalanine--tRNA ligase subunit alpha [Candidatus Woesearchaeota archaeon B3_Woes]|nr:MAG: phenylalanine--tRNA ligase subunit alpha [Candidatus Woesearchaeota archaeon B3_Woes]